MLIQYATVVSELKLRSYQLAAFYPTMALHCSKRLWPKGIWGQVDSVLNRDIVEYLRKRPLADIGWIWAGKVVTRVAMRDDSLILRAWTTITA